MTDKIGGRTSGISSKYTVTNEMNASKVKTLKYKGYYKAYFGLKKLLADLKRTNKYNRNYLRIKKTIRELQSLNKIVHEHWNIQPWRNPPYQYIPKISPKYFEDFVKNMNNQIKNLKR